VGYQLFSLKKIIAGKVSLASVVVTPLVVGGLAMVGFQTYSLITGKSFKDFDFDIGRLWEQVTTGNEPKQAKESAVIRNVFPTIPLEPTENRLVAFPQKNIELPFITSKDAKLVVPNKYEENVSPQISSLGTLPNISNIDLPTYLVNPILTKYYNRLTSDYLISPDITPYTGKWFVGFSFSPTLNYRTFGYDASRVSGVAIDGNYRYTFGLTEKERNASDKAITSYNIGIDVGRSIGTKMRLNTGIYYATYGEQLQVSPADESNLNYPNASFYGHKPLYEVYNPMEPEHNIPYSNRYAFVEIPVGLSFDFMHFDKSKISVDAALNFQKLLEVNALVYDFNTDYYYWITENNELFRDFGLGAGLGITAAQFVSNKLELFVNPQFKINLNSTFQNPYPVNQNQYSTGLRIGFRQQLF
jgi:hypothetical protein